MATTRTFAYNVGATVSGTQKMGSIAIGRPTSGFFATGLTWRGGPDEDLGYIIAYTATPPRTAGGNTISISVNDIGYKRSIAKTDQSFINLANQIGATSFASAIAAKTWLNTNGYWTNWIPIIDSGLVLYLDAGLTASYPRTGTTWIDLSASGNIATLVNGPTFSSTNEGNFIFDGVNDYCSTSLVKTFTSMTIQVWFRGDGANQNGTYGFAGVVANRTSPADATGLLLNNNNNKSLGYSWNGVTNTWSWNSGLVLDYYGWHFLSLTVTPTLATAFLNGATATNVVNHASTSITSLAIGKDYVTERYVTGGIASVSVYDRALSNAEVLQNYNATKDRFANATIGYTVYNGCNAASAVIWVASAGLTVGKTVYADSNLTTLYASQTFSQNVWPDDPDYSADGIVTNSSGIITSITQTIGGCNVQTYC